jgi:hypothetical protein
MGSLAVGGYPTAGNGEAFQHGDRQVVAGSGGSRPNTGEDAPTTGFDPLKSSVTGSFVAFRFHRLRG